MNYIFLINCILESYIPYISDVEKYVLFLFSTLKRTTLLSSRYLLSDSLI